MRWQSDGYKNLKWEYFTSEGGLGILANNIPRIDNTTKEKRLELNISNSLGNWLDCDILCMVVSSERIGRPFPLAYSLLAFSGKSFSS